MYFIDVQGTLISDDDKSPIRGSREFIQKLNTLKIPYIIITNSTKKSSEEFFSFLKKSGFDIDFSSYLDPLMVLERSVAKDGVAAYGSGEFLELLQTMGYELDYTAPKSVLISIKEDFTNEEFAQIIEFVLGGANLFGMHETSLYAKNAKRYPGVGAILKMIEFATSAKYSVIGKPSREFYGEALEMIKKRVSEASFENITIISDDVKGDLGGAKELGMKSWFVLSGKYKNADEIVPALPVEARPDAVYADMQDILESVYENA